MQTSNIGPQKTAFENLSPRAYFRNSFYDRLQNSPYFCVFKYARAVEQKVGNEAENRERDLGRACDTRALRVRKTLTPHFTDFFTDFEKKNRLFCSLLLRGRTGRVRRRCPLQEYWPFSLQKDAFCEHWKELQRGWIPSNLISIPAGRKPMFSANTLRHMRRF